MRAHNWVALGALLEDDAKPARSRTVSGRLCFRKPQWPGRPKAPGLTEPFRTERRLAVELLRGQAGVAKQPHLGAFDGGYASKDVVRPLVVPEESSPSRRLSDPTGFLELWF